MALTGKSSSGLEPARRLRECSFRALMLVRYGVMYSEISRTGLDIKPRFSSFASRDSYHYRFH